MYNNGQVLDSPQPITGWYEDGFALKDREATQMWLERSKEEQLVDDGALGCAGGGMSAAEPEMLFFQVVDPYPGRKTVAELSCV